VSIYPETPVLFESTERAIGDAQAWLEQLPPANPNADGAGVVRS
jgi:hypothetical protein